MGAVVPCLHWGSLSLEPDRGKRIAAGMDGYLSKPIDQSRLAWILAQVSTRGSFEFGDPSLTVVAPSIA